MKVKFHNLRLFLALAVITGVVYPLFITGVGLTCFPHESRGSMIYAEDGRPVGSELIAQPTTSPEHFWPRPSAGDYSTLPSGASNLAWSSSDLKKTVDERRKMILAAHNLPEGTPVPSDLLFASGSGLDPHISPAAAMFQLDRVASARKLPREEVQKLIRKNTIHGGIWGEDRVKVLTLNLDLDRIR